MIATGRTTGSTGYTTGQSSSVTGSLAGLTNAAGAKIAGAIQNASAKTGVDFSYLLQQAKIESSFKTDAKACSSSATGLYQFIDRTWLSMVNKYGDKYGLSDLSSQISDNGTVKNASVRQQILDLRKNPEIASLMAAELASDNKAYLENCTGQTADATDLYMAHFMGPAGAAKFLKALDKTPDANAATLFPTAASANKGVFYDKSGQARTLEQVYALFDQKFSLSDGATACTANATSRPETLPSQTASATDATTANVLAALTPNSATTTPLYSKHTSLFTNDTHTAETTSHGLPTSSLYAMLSPVDVLELLKNQYTDHKGNG